MPARTPHPTTCRSTMNAAMEPIAVHSPELSPFLNRDSRAGVRTGAAIRARLGRARTLVQLACNKARSPATRSRAERPAELPGEVALIGEAGVHGGIRERSAGGDGRPGEVEPAQQPEAVGGRAMNGAELPDEGVAVEPGDALELCGGCRCRRLGE